MASRFMGSGNRRPGIMGAIPKPVSNRRPRPPMRYIGEDAPGAGAPVRQPFQQAPKPPQVEREETLADLIMAYLGSDQADVYREDYDIDGDGEISLRDSIYQLQIQEGKRNPDGIPAQTQTPPPGMPPRPGPIRDPQQPPPRTPPDGYNPNWQLYGGGTDLLDYANNPSFQMVRNMHRSMPEMTQGFLDSRGFEPPMPPPMEDPVNDAVNNIPPPMEDPVNDAVNNMPGKGRFPGKFGPRFPGTGPIRQPEPVGPLPGMPPPYTPPPPGPGTPPPPGPGLSIPPPDDPPPFRKDDWGTSCPSPKEHIQLANNNWILAGELKVGDEVITSEDPQKVTFAKTIEDSPRREVLFTEGDSIVTSPSHPYFVKDKGFVDVEDLKEGDEIGDLIVSEVKPFSDGPVIHISVDKAQTYMLRGGTEENPVPALSHNKSPIWPPDPEPDPTTPTGQGTDPGGPPPVDIDGDGTGSPPVNPQVPGMPQNPTVGQEWTLPPELGGQTLVWNGSTYVPKEVYDMGVGTGTNPPPGTPPPDTTTPPPDTTTPPPDTTTPPPDTTTPPPDTGTGTTGVQGMTMEEMQAMIDKLNAEKAANEAAQAAAAQKYTIDPARVGNNPYLTGQYQADPYGASGVPNMGGLTTIPVPQSLTGIGYANYNPRRQT